MKKLALPNVEGDLFVMGEDLIERGLQESRESPRRRMILPVHRIQEAQVQRLVNFLQPGTYIRPHKHPLPHASESIVLLSGKIRFYTFTNGGSVQTVMNLDSVSIPSVLDIEPNVWHSFLVLQKDTILFECKKGPYDAKKDKIFAEWAPEEGSQEGLNWLKSLREK